MAHGEALFSNGQVILVTGASSGIGQAIALECNAEGGTVLACGRDAQRLETARLQCAFPERWTSVQRDLLDDMALLPDWVRGLAAEHGKLWGLVHVAGAGLMDTLRSYDHETACKHVDLNFHAAMLLAQGFCDRRASVRGGALLFMASASAVFPEKGHLTYGATKAALVAAAKSISEEVAPLGLRVHCLSPGIVDTELQRRMEALMGPDYRQEQLQGYPFGFGRPEDVAHMASFLLSERAKWITGQNFVLAGGRY